MCALICITQPLSPIMQHWSVIHSSLFAETDRRGSQGRGRGESIIAISRNINERRYIIGANSIFLASAIRGLEEARERVRKISRKSAQRRGSHGEDA